MKISVLILIVVVAVFSQSVSFANPQCTEKCKVALIDAEFEFDFHSGTSVSQIAESLYTACGKNEDIENTCAKAIRPDEGTIVYLNYASCVFRGIKSDCQNRYEANRP